MATLCCIFSTPNIPSKYTKNDTRSVCKASRPHRTKKKQKKTRENFVFFFTGNELNRLEYNSLLLFVVLLLVLVLVLVLVLMVFVFVEIGRVKKKKTETKTKVLFLLLSFFVIICLFVVRAQLYICLCVCKCVCMFALRFEDNSIEE